MVKRGVLFLTAILFLLTVFSSTKVVNAQEPAIKLKWSSPFMPPEPPNVFANHTLDLVEKKTKGKVKIERFMAGALGGRHEQLALVSSGAVDLITLHIDQFPQQLPLHQVTNTEQLVSGAEGLKNVTALVHQSPETKPLFEAEQKKNNIRILHFYVNGPTGITTRFPARSLADLKGKKINTLAAFHRKAFSELGWIPVNVYIPELYEALTRGVIDAIFMATAAVVPLKWYEPAKAHLVLGENTVVSTPLAFNLDVWNKLPKDVQDAFLEASWETAQWTVTVNEKMWKDTYEIFKKKGVQVVNISKAENRKFFEVFFKIQTEDLMEKFRAGGVEKEGKGIIDYWEKVRWGKSR